MPVAPFVVLAAVVGIGVLAATGRPSRLLRLAHHHILDGALFVIAGVALSDVPMLAVAAAATGDAAVVSTTVAVAGVASLIRLGISVVAATRCLQSHRILPCC